MAGENYYNEFDWYWNNTDAFGVYLRVICITFRIFNLWTSAAGRHSSRIIFRNLDSCQPMHGYGIAERILAYVGVRARGKTLDTDRMTLCVR
jgi:hypothetical protein